MDHLTDIELVALSLEGNAPAFEHLVKRHYGTVFRLSYKWCGLKEDAEDIAQEVFIKLAQKLKTFGQKSSFKTWIYRITVNTAKDFIRKSITKRGYENAYVIEQEDANPGPPVGHHLEAKRLVKALGRLPEKQKAAVLLVLSEGLSHQEAARVLNCPERTVSWRIFQARKSLKKYLEHPI
ncbi:MAG: RNA polymerase sigma factor [Thermodesulfobacteriota bacterium]